MASVFLAYEYRRTDLNINMRLTFECDYPEDIVTSEKITPKISTTFSGQIQKSAMYQNGNSTFYLVLVSKRNQTIRVRWYENGSQVYTETFTLSTGNGQGTLYTKYSETGANPSYAFSWNDNGTGWTSGQGISVTINTYNIMFATDLPTYKLMYSGEYVQNVWETVASISGNNETHALAQVDSESINDGEPVSDLVASDFIALPDAIKVKALADARVLEV